MAVVLLITSKDIKEANKIVKNLISTKLIACANIIKTVQSVFWWEGKVDRTSEVLIILKTKKSLISKITEMVKSLHSYTVPEVIALPIVGGNKDYLQWIGHAVCRCRKRQG